VFGAAIVLLRIAGQDVSVVRALLGALAYGGGLLLLHLAYPRGMGFGDVKFAGLLGLVLGSLGWAYVAVAAFAAVFSAGIAGVAVLALGGTRKSKLPFGVFMALGALVAIVFAPAIASWYLGLAR
jgi:leader peptidase (prepilin peptidase) / N-methyltransferase